MSDLVSVNDDKVLNDLQHEIDHLRQELKAEKERREVAEEEIDKYRETLDEILIMARKVL